MTPDEIRNLRTSMGLTQREFGQLIDAPQRMVSRWEKAVYRPNKFYRALLELVKKNHEAGVYTDTKLARYKFQVGLQAQE